MIENLCLKIYEKMPLCLKDSPYEQKLKLCVEFNTLQEKKIQIEVCGGATTTRTLFMN